MKNVVLTIDIDPDVNYTFDIDSLDEFVYLLNQLSDVELINSDIYFNYKTNYNEDNSEKEISEKIKQQNKDTLLAYYSIPKKIVFTQKFQDRIRYEIPAVIESIYPNLYDIYDISFIEDTPETMKLNIKIKGKTSDAIRNQDYLEENIGYIVDDIVSYYMK